MSDNTIWKTIGGKKNFCSFKHHSQTEIFCKHPNNVTSICEENACPLSNSKYATIREKNGKLYLYIKEPERVQTPCKQYEQIELSCNYEQAILQIDNELKYFNDFLIHKCKQRLTNLTLYLERKETIRVEKEMEQIPRLSVIKRRFMKREKKAADKTYKKMNVEKEIEKELIERMKAGIYGDELKHKLKEREVIKDCVIKKEKKAHKKKFIAYFDESDEDILTAEELKKRKGKNLKW